jgi:DegV family protein with EDD domain
MIEKHQIIVVPVGMVVEGKFYRDLVDISRDQFWKIFPGLKEQPSSTAGNPGDFVKAFLEAGQTTDDVVCIVVSKVLTATFESAFQARKTARTEKPELNIEIVDSHTSAGALGFIALEAAKAAEAGKSLAEVMEIVENMVSRVIYLATMDTLKYMIRAGRAPRNSSGFGEILQIKPVIGFVDDSGITEVVARVRGKQGSLEKLVELVSKYVDVKQPLHFMVHYSNSLEDAQELSKLVQRKYKKAEVHLSEYSPVMCIYTGPCTGLSFYV